MSTAVASVAPPLAPPPAEPDSSPQSTYPTLAPSTHAPAHIERMSASATSRTTSPNAPVVLGESAAKQKVTPDGKLSPNSYVFYTFTPLFHLHIPSLLLPFFSRYSRQ